MLINPVEKILAGHGLHIKRAKKGMNMDAFLDQKENLLIMLIVYLTKSLMGQYPMSLKFAINVTIPNV